MIIELQEGDWAQLTEGEYEGVYAEVLTELDGEGYHVIALDNGEQWQVPAHMLAPVIEVYAQEVPHENQAAAPPFGMSSDQVAHYAEQFLNGCLGRITGVGNAQYATEHYQRFETMNPLEVLDNIEEEILDIPNYCVFLYILIQRMKQGLGEAALG